MRGKRLFINCEVEAVVDYENGDYVLRFMQVPKLRDDAIAHPEQVAIRMTEGCVSELAEYLQGTLAEAAEERRKSLEYWASRPSATTKTEES